MELTEPEGRVLGALVEKELTTPQAYPLTDNALLVACNQTTSRDPVVTYDVATVRLAVRSLREQGLLRTVHRTGERSDKHRHELAHELELSPAQVALLGVLLLRGPQTVAELRARTERMHPFTAPAEVEDALAGMAERDEPLVERLAREPGRKESRYVQRIAGGPGPGDRHAELGISLDATVCGPLSLSQLADEVAALRGDVALLRDEVRRLSQG